MDLKSPEAKFVSVILAFVTHLKGFNKVSDQQLGPFVP